MLSPYRVLDATDDRGEIAGMVLGDLGAEVIKVEPPGGSEGRRRGPSLSGAPAGQGSLQFLAYNGGKRSIVLDLSARGDRDTLLDLVASADFVLESAPPGYLTGNGLGFEQLRARNPRIVHVQITPFGSDGPYAEFPASDLTIAALGGPVALQGVPERAPVRVTVPQVWRHAGAEAAVAALVAHARVRSTGEAQFVDVSAQCAMTWTLLNAMDAAAIQGFDYERMGSTIQLGLSNPPLVYECADGHIIALPIGVSVGRFVSWMVEDGVVDPSWADDDWPSYDRRSQFGGEIAFTPDEVYDALRRFFSKYQKAELLARGLEQGVTFAPVNTIDDTLSFRQLAERRYWSSVELPDGRALRAPGAFARLTATPLRARTSAPRLDEHGAEIRRELATGARRMSTPDAAPKTNLPLEGLKVADFSWVGVGPISARYLADHGATTVRVESEGRPDVLRGGGPFKDNQSGINRSQFFGDFNTSKLGLQLDLKNDAARDVAKRLIAWADVYIESFTAGTVDRLGIGYETARALNPSIVMLSTCLLGQTGPLAQMAGYGNQAGAMAGFYEVTGWPDLPPDGPYMAYTDTVAPRFAVATLLAALDNRRRTGRGQHIDGGQLEMALHFLAPEILEYQATGYMATRLGNRSRDAAPHGVYACAGDDQWCAIAVESDEQWQALCKALGAPAWARDPTLDTVEGRLLAQAAIDAELGAWTCAREPARVADELRAAGVPAGVVQRSSDLLRDPQYLHRGFYHYLEHPEMGRVPYAGHQFRIRGYQSGPRSPAPTLGQHVSEVLQGVLGMSDDEIAEAIAAGAIG